MIDFSHLDALQSRLSREKARLAVAQNMRWSKRRDNEIAFRQREIAACEKEIAGEYQFLGLEPPSLDEILMSDDELLAELGL